MNAASADPQSHSAEALIVFLSFSTGARIVILSAARGTRA